MNYINIQEIDSLQEWVKEAIAIKKIHCNINL